MDENDRDLSGCLSLFMILACLGVVAWLFYAAITARHP